MEDEKMFGTVKQGGNIRRLLADAAAKIKTANDFLRSDQVSGMSVVAREGFIEGVRRTVPQYLNQAYTDIELVLSLESQVIQIFEAAEKQVDAQLKAKLGT